MKLSQLELEACCPKFWKLGLVLEVRLRRNWTLHAYPAFLYLVVVTTVVTFLPVIKFAYDVTDG